MRVFVIATVLASAENNAHRAIGQVPETSHEPSIIVVGPETTPEDALVDGSACDTSNDVIELNSDEELGKVTERNVIRMLARLNISSEHADAAVGVLTDCMAADHLRMSVDDIGVNTLRACALYRASEESEHPARLAFIDALLELPQPFNPLRVYLGQRNLFNIIMSEWKESLNVPRILRAIVRHIEAVFGKDTSAYAINTAVEIFALASRHDAILVFAESMLAFDRLGALTFVYNHNPEDGTLQAALLRHVSDEDLRHALCSPWFMSCGRGFLLAEARKRGMDTYGLRESLDFMLRYMPKTIIADVTGQGSLRAAADALMRAHTHSVYKHSLIRFGKHSGEMFWTCLAVSAARHNRVAFLKEMNRNNMLPDTVLTNGLVLLARATRIDAMARLLNAEPEGRCLHGVSNYAATFVTCVFKNQEDFGPNVIALDTVNGAWGRYIASVKLVLLLGANLYVHDFEHVKIVTVLSQHLSQYESIRERFLELTAASLIATRAVGHHVLAAPLLAAMLRHAQCPDLLVLARFAAQSGNPMFFEDINGLSATAVAHQRTYYRIHCHDLVKGLAADGVTLAAMNWLAEGGHE